MAKFFENFKHDAGVYAATMKLQFRAGAALRGAFITQVIGMVFNNLALLAAWLFLFARFGTIHGWNSAQLVGLQGINMLIYGLMLGAAGGITMLPQHVDQGSFDTFLTRPVGVITQIASCAFDVSTLGDFGLGVVLVAWYVLHAHASAMALLLFVTLMLIGCVLFWCFVGLLPSTLAFYVFDSERLIRYFAYVFLDGGIYPTGVIGGALRAVLLTGFPALFIGAVQIDVLRGLHWWLVGLGAIVTAFWCAFSLWLFRRSVRRYESANLVGAR